MNAARNEDRAKDDQAAPTPVAELMRAGVDAMEVFMKTDWSKDAEKAGLHVNPLFANPAAMMAAATAMGVKMTGQWAGAFVNAMEQAAAGTDVEEDPAQPDENPKSDVQPEAEINAADDLKRISGIGPKLEQVLAGRGIRTFSDLAALNSASVEAIDSEFGLGGRIVRDDWVGQAKALIGEVADASR